jgi:hypothetical protein
MKLNGWQRIGVILSALWVLGISSWIKDSWKIWLPAALIPIVLVWLLIYLLLWIYRWIIAGGLPQPIARHAHKLPILIVIIVALSVAYQYQHKQNKLRALGRCEMSAEKLQNGDKRIDVSDYMHSCMRAEGYESEWGDHAYDCAMANNPDCYE